MRRVTAIGIALLVCHTTLAFADARRGEEAFARGDFLAAEREWRQSAMAGDTSAMLGLGMLYDTGHGVHQDFAQALSWYRRAANAGSGRAMFNVGAMYDSGRGIDANRREAMRWYVLSAAKGNGRAAYVAATIYRDGDGMPQSATAARKFFKMAAAAGIGAARVNLASLGQGVPSASLTSSSSPPGGMAKTSRSIAAAAKHSPVLSKVNDAASVEKKPGLLPTMSPASFGNAVAQAASSRPAGIDPATPSAPAGAAHDSTTVAAINIPVGSLGLSDPSSVEFIAPEEVEAAVERFHKVALQHVGVSAPLLKQYESIVSEVVRRAVEGNNVAQYDTGFAYERGIGLPANLVKAYVYYLQATASPDVRLKSVALKQATEISERLTDAEFIAAIDMVTVGTR